MLRHHFAVVFKGEEAAILEDMEVAVADLGDVTFAIIKAKTEEPEDLLPTISGTWWETHIHACNHTPHTHDVFSDPGVV